MADQNIKQVVTKDDVPGLDLVPTFVNRFNVTMGPITTRIALGEHVVGDQDQNTVFTSALVMPTSDALSLAHLIIQLFETNAGAQAVQKTLMELADKASRQER
ncbi:hypothetical protein [Hyphomicrobium sp. CS1GBMeth3]|uniref:hypothetical protein n=1 Tax=Hyphomicrobium sp. CS1GBMeth3 TaxID=1892845 RepID=UPI0009308255|nr:hypothetical protein [Hyphomicrobium sp. CS1GBMeth3]